MSAETVAISVMRTHSVPTLLGATPVPVMMDSLEMGSHALLFSCNWSVVQDTNHGARDAWVSWKTVSKSACWIFY